MESVVEIFLLALVSDFLWQHAHVSLYRHYKGGKITEFILLRAILFDAVTIILLSIPFLTVAYFQVRLWYAFIFGIILSVIIEWYGLATKRWAYNEKMPIIPILQVGLTPTLQLGVLAYLIYWIVL